MTDSYREFSIPVANAEPWTVERYQKELQLTQDARNRDWRRFNALERAVRHALTTGDQTSLSVIYNKLSDPAWLPEPNQPKPDENE